MKHLILSWLLHHANRSIGFERVCRDEFYLIKDKILKQHGQHLDYEVQKIDGKKCFTCDGSGVYTGYYMMSGEKWQDTCNRCCGDGWYVLPKWICLSRIKFGPYIFHKPLKREQCVRNPWTERNMGWVVTNRPIIQGYIEHNRSRFGQISLLILYLRYDPVTFEKSKNALINSIRWDITWKWRRFKKTFHWSRLLIAKPQLRTYFLDENGNIDDYPF